MNCITINTETKCCYVIIIPQKQNNSYKATNRLHSFTKHRRQIHFKLNPNEASDINQIFILSVLPLYAGLSCSQNWQLKSKHYVNTVFKKEKILIQNWGMKMLKVGFPDALIRL